MKGLFKNVPGKCLRIVYRSYLGLGCSFPRFLQNSGLIVQIAAREYQPRLYGGRIVLFRSQHRPEEDLYHGWEKLALGGLEVHEVPEDHWSMFQKPNVTVLARELSTALENARRTPRAR